MHVALAVQSMKIERGGIERFTKNLIAGLLQREHKISVFCYEYDALAEKLGINLYKIKSPGKFRHPWYEFSKNVHAVLDDLSTPKKPDVLFGLTQLKPQDVHRFGGGVYKYWFQKKYGAFYNLKKYFPKTYYSLKFEKEMYENLKHIISISNMDKKLLQEYYDLNPEKITTIYNGFDFSEFNNIGKVQARLNFCQQHNISQEKRLAIFSANNYIRKGLPQAIEAMLRVNKPDDFVLVVAGKGSDSVKKTLTQKIKNNFRCIWLDYVANPAELYRSCDFMLFPTLYDSFANVTAEALLCGLPLITTAQAGGSEMVVEGENGFVIGDASDIETMAAKIEFLRDPSICDAFADKAPWLASQYSIEHCAKETEKILLNVMQNR